MNKLNMLLIIFLVLLITFPVAGYNSLLIFDKLVIGEMSWAPNEQMLIVKPFEKSPFLIYKEKNTWLKKPLLINSKAKFFRWSNSGDQVLYWFNGSIYIYEMVGNSINITKASESQPNWSPDGKYFTYIWENNVWICSTDLREKKKVTKRSIDEATCPQWAESSKEIVFQGAKKEGYTIWKVNINTGDTKIINNKLGCYYYGWPLWNNGIPVIDEVTSDLKVLFLNGKITNLTTDRLDGRVIIHYGKDGLYYTDDNRNLYNLINGSVRLVLRGVDYVELSPKGNFIAYSSGDKLYITENR